MKSNNKLKSLAFNFNPFRIRNPVLYPLSYGGNSVSCRGLRISDGLLKFNKEMKYGECGIRSAGGGKRKDSGIQELRD